MNELSFKTPVKGVLFLNGEYLPPSPQIPDSAFKSPQTSAFNTPFIKRKYSRNHTDFLLSLQNESQSTTIQKSPEKAKKSHSIKDFLPPIIILSFLLIYFSPLFSILFLVSTVSYLRIISSMDVENKNEAVPASGRGSRTPSPMRC